MNPTSIRNQFCTNPQCNQFEKIGAQNIVSHAKHSPRFRCKNCGQTWSGRYSELTFIIRKDKKILDAAMEFLRKGLSVRATARRVRVTPGTIQRWKKQFIS